jgi:3-oxo-5-alpha-steroid 4-dehydrogenase 1
LYGWIGLAAVIFFVLLRVRAPYGRHVSKNWGPQIDNRLGWFMMESPGVILLSFFVLPNINQWSSPSWIMLGLFALHYINRAFIFPFRLHTQGKKIPWAIVGSAIFFNLANGFFLGYYFVHFANYYSSWLSNPRFILGMGLFIVGVYINWKSDDLLIHLRLPAETHYVIPDGWLFRHISCPNLFGELLEWFGFAILCWNLPALAFFCWTAANLIPRAMAHHVWYKKRFKNYPLTRRAIIPFVL